MPPSRAPSPGEDDDDMDGPVPPKEKPPGRPIPPGKPPPARPLPPGAKKPDEDVPKPPEEDVPIVSFYL